jgi:chemotaxis protein CheD
MTLSDQAFFLNSGELLFSRDECTVITILGSCVGVAVHDPVLRLGGLCHYLLPESLESTASTRYGDVALPYLFSKFKKAGSLRKDLRAWVVGGSLLLEAHEIFFVGDRNADFAEKFLKDLGVKVVQNETRGYRGRKLTFQPHVGLMKIEEIPSSALKDMLII